MSSLADRDLASAPLEQRQPTAAPRPFLGLIEAVTVEDPVLFPFDGSILRKHAQNAWIWAARDLCPDLLGDIEAVSKANLEALMPQVVTRMRDGLKQAEDYETGRRLRAQLGGPEALERLPFVINALHSRALLVKAEAFGKAVNGIDNDHTLGAALQAMPLQDVSATALLMHVAIGQISNPTRLVTTALRLSGGGSEAAIQRGGFAPLVDAILAHAQNQLHALQQTGPFADVDMTCRALDRFHRLVRSLTGYVEFARNSRWTMVLAALTKHTSDRIEQRLKDVVPDLNQALRKMPGTDRLDHDRLLSALNGMYLLAAVRDSRDSLAVNALFDLAWSQSGEALELHLARNLELFKLNPDDVLIGTRLDAAIKMAEIRFNAEYAETLRRARHTAERRA
ncbi:hypothetical protein ABIB57_000641 [Devosia sp. UYZn731]|uniref:hypothetical protein n=1 Tax=Devosia sp. UYZn731 TaxID=3156345 RepID=UPI003392D4FF